MSPAGQSRAVRACSYRVAPCLVIGVNSAAAVTQALVTNFPIGGITLHPSCQSQDGEAPRLNGKV